MHALLRFLLAVTAVAWLGTTTEPDRNLPRPTTPLPVAAAPWITLLILQIDRLEDMSPRGEPATQDPRARPQDARAALERLQIAISDSVSGEQLAYAFCEADQRVDELMAALALPEARQGIPAAELVRLGECHDQLRRRFIPNDDELAAQDQLLRVLLDLLADEARDLQRTAQCASDLDQPGFMALEGDLVALIKATLKLQAAREASRTLPDDDALENAWQEVARRLQTLGPAENVVVLRRAARVERLLDCLCLLGSVKAERPCLAVRS
jgi:hypothetical protein